MDERLRIMRTRLENLIAGAGDFTDRGRKTVIRMCRKALAEIEAERDDCGH